MREGNFFVASRIPGTPGVATLLPCRGKSRRREARLRRGVELGGRCCSDTRNANALRLRMNNENCLRVAEVTLPAGRKEGDTVILSTGNNDLR